MESMFIERVTLEIPKPITLFLTDKLIYEIVSIGRGIGT
jgi:hypothetical protein